MHQQQLGRLKVNKVLESYMASAGLPVSMIFPDVTQDDMQKLAGWCPLPEVTEDPATSLIALSVHSFVIQLDGQNILIDSCNGNHKTRALDMVDNLETPYLENLAAVGLKPEDIHLVMCTHLHFDHVGWNTRLENGRWVPTFPNARYLFGKRDYEHWSTQDDEAEFIHRQAFDDSVLPVVQAGLADIIDTDDPVAVRQEIGNGVWIEPAYGHSPGCVTVSAQADGAPALFWGDIVHHPVQMIRPELTLPFDHDQPTAAKTRLAMLDRIADSDTICFPAHFADPSVGRVLRDGSAYRYQFIDS